MSKRKLGTFTTAYYQVETTWPEVRAGEQEEFGTYNASGFTLADDPGSRRAQWAVARRPDLFDKRVGGKFGESLIFAERDDAIAVADLLASQGRMTAGWEDSAEWRVKQQGPIKARVVLEIKTLHRELVHASK